MTAATATADMPNKPAAKDSWQDYAATPQSFGEKWGKKVHWFLTDIGVNYFVNVTISVGLTYAFEKTLGAKYNQWLDNTVQNVPTAFKGAAKFIMKFATKSQILLMGGHTLIPFMKHFHDNQHSEIASISHTLDSLADTLGQGNEASRQNIADYGRLQQLMKDKPQGITGDDARILTKYGINGDYKFIEEKKAWKDVLLARFRGMMFSLATNATIGGIEGKTLDGNGKGWYNRFWADPISTGAGRWPGLSKFFGKIPGFKKVFPDTALFGREYANDLILTAASTIGFMTGMDASDKKGPNHNEICEKNKAYWTSRVAKPESSLAEGQVLAQASTPARDESPKTASEKILAENRPADMAGRVEARNEAEQPAQATR